jgi:fructose-1,6-bisphosphatase II
MGGEFLGKLVFRSNEERERAIAMGLKDPEQSFRVEDLVRGDVIFVATGVTGGPLLKGVRRIGDRLHLQSVAIRSKTGTIRWVDTSVDAHRFEHDH